MRLPSSNTLKDRLLLLSLEYLGVFRLTLLFTLLASSLMYSTLPINPDSSEISFTPSLSPMKLSPLSVTYNVVLSTCQSREYSEDSFSKHLLGLPDNWYPSGNCCLTFSPLISTLVISGTDLVISVIASFTDNP